MRRSAFGWLTPLVEPVPIATRSYMSIAVAWFQPLFSSPSSQLFGMRTSVKKISLKCLPPSIWWMARISMPGAFMSTMNIEMPACLGASGLVRATMTP